MMDVKAVSVSTSLSGQGDSEMVESFQLSVGAAVRAGAVMADMARFGIGVLDGAGTMGDVAPRTAATQAAVVSLDSGAEVSTTPVDTAKANSQGKGSASDADGKAEAAASFNTGATGYDAVRVEGAHGENTALRIAAIDADTAAVKAKRADKVQADGVGSNATTVARADTTVDERRGDGAYEEAGSPKIAICRSHQPYLWNKVFTCRERAFDRRSRL